MKLISRMALVFVFVAIFLFGCNIIPSATTKEVESDEQERETQDKIVGTKESKVQDVTIEVQESKDGDHTFICECEGVKHDFVLDLPEVSENAPLILMLHGYGESADAFRTKTAFHQQANEQGFAVVYVTGAPSPEDATSSNGWNSGVGENSNDDVRFLGGLAKYLCEKYNFDSTRIYAVGFSNGAFMTHRLAMEAGDIFNSVVSVAGMMSESIWENRNEDCNVGIFQITGEKDDVVPKNSDGSVKYAKAPAIEDVMDFYVAKNKLELLENETVGKKSTLKKYASKESSVQVWDLFIPDGRHAWPDSQITGVNVNQLILEYFVAQSKK